MDGMLTVKIPYEVTDEIVVRTLQASRAMIKEQLQEFYEKTSWLHPDDVQYSYEVLNAIEVLGVYFGGEGVFAEEPDPEMDDKEPEMDDKEPEAELYQRIRDGEEMALTIDQEYINAFLDALDRT